MSTDSFGTFLNTYNALGALSESSEAKSSGAGDELGGLQALTSSPGKLKILSTLAAHDTTSVPFKELQAEARMNITNFYPAVEDLSKSGFVIVVGEPANEKVELTPQGSEFVSSLRAIADEIRTNESNADS